MAYFWYLGRFLVSWQILAGFGILADFVILADFWYLGRFLVSWQIFARYSQKTFVDT
jgi:hypothetical protein